MRSIARERLIFFEQLRGVSTRTIVDPGAVILASAATDVAVILALATPAATATGLLTIVYQDCVVLSKRVFKIPLRPLLRNRRIRTAGRSLAVPDL